MKATVYHSYGSPDVVKLVTKEVAWRQLPETAKPTQGFLRVTEYLQMDLRS